MSKLTDELRNAQTLRGELRCGFDVSPTVATAAADRIDALEALLRDIYDRGSLGYEPGDEDLRVRIAAALKDTP
jgi:hypothetical protein